ncbi:MAG: glycosyl hydrolase family 31 [Hassallia sp.]
MTLKHLAIVKDGKIELLDPVSIPEGTKVFIIPIYLETDPEEKDNWEHFALKSLNQCYAKDEPEYTLESIQEYNHNYERR